MFGFGKPKNPDEHRYYLLPGQGRGVRQKRRRQLVAALIVGTIFAAGLGAIIWWMDKTNFDNVVDWNAKVGRNGLRQHLGARGDTRALH